MHSTISILPQFTINFSAAQLVAFQSTSVNVLAQYISAQCSLYYCLTFHMRSFTPHPSTVQRTGIALMQVFEPHIESLHHPASFTQPTEVRFLWIKIRLFPFFQNCIIKLFPWSSLFIEKWNQFWQSSCRCPATQLNVLWPSFRPVSSPHVISSISTLSSSSPKYFKFSATPVVTWSLGWQSFRLA